MNAATRGLETRERGGAFVVLDPEWRQKIFFGGLLILLCHPIGWPIALGYRKVLISHLALGLDPVLPEWKGNVCRFYLEGLKAMGVIFGYLMPLYSVLLCLLLANGVRPNEYWLYAFMFFAIAIMFSTLSFPSIVMYWTLFSEGYRVPPWISVLLLTCYGLTVFFIPAGFLQVSQTGRYLSAFHLPAAFRTMVRHFRKYVVAWYRSGIMSLSGHFALPFAPWGVFWCYLGIIYEFNSILHSDFDANSDRASCGTSSWYERLKTEERLRLRSTEYSFVYECLGIDDRIVCLMIKIGPTVIPLPSLVEKRLKRGK
jgi:hypothetical protein